MHRHANPALFGDEPYVKPYRQSEILLLGVVERAEPYALTAGAGPVVLAPGQKVDVTVTAARNAGADGEIKLEFRGLPNKVSATPAALPAGQSEVKVTLSAAADAPTTTTNLVVVGKLDRHTQAAPAMRIDVKK
jgi:hypothetical protein